MMCFEVCDFPVEGELEQTSAHHTEQLNLEVNLEETNNSEVHLEAQLEQSLSLQDWLNSETQSPVTHQWHMTEIRLEHQSCMVENEAHTNEV